MDQSVEDLFVEAEAAEESGDLPKAVRAYRRILELAPDDPRAARELARIAPFRRDKPPAPDAVPTDEMEALLDLYKAGRFDATIEQAEGLLVRYPAAANIANLIGIAHARERRFDKAADAFARATAMKPDYAEAHHHLGSALLEQRRVAEAVAAYEMAVATRPDFYAAIGSLGNALKVQGRAEEAVAAFRRALAIRPDHLTSWYNLANTLRELGRREDAIAAYEAALALAPNNPDIHTNFGNALRELGRWDEALAAFRKVVAISPDYPQGHYNLGTVLMERGRLDEAIAAYRQAIALRPDYPEAHNNLCDAFLQLDRLDDAEAACHRALALRPDYPNALNGLGNVLKERGRNAEAAEAYRRALAQRPGYTKARVNLGNVLAELDRSDESVATFQQVLAEDPHNADALCNLSLLHLARGEFARGWAGYEWRKRRTPPIALRHFEQPLWRGEDVRGKAVFLYPEQGFGDTIQFIRYAALVRDRGARVTAAVQPLLLPLLAGTIPGVDIVADGSPPPFDYHAPLLSLPNALHTDIASIPADIPYLSADPERVGKWRDRLGGEGFKIGICWQGSKTKADRGRSFPLALFAPIAGLPGVRLISLHKGAGEDQLDALPEDMRVEVPGPNFDPEGEAFLDTAAVMKVCDLVITSDTSVAHVAGALGVPTWTVLRRVANWRWLEDRRDTPWYPTMRLFRQPTLGDWATPFGEMEQELRGLLAERALVGQGAP